MSDGEPPRSPAAWSSWEKRTSIITSFGRRLTRKHYFIGLAVLLVTTIFLANPYHTFVKSHEPHAATVPRPDTISTSMAVTPTPSPPVPVQVEKPAEEVASPPKEPEQKPAEEPKPKPEEKKPEPPVSEEMEKPAPEDEDGPEEPVDPEFCTTWPVGPKGKYTPKTQPGGSKQQQLASFAPAGGWKKPQGVRVVAMVFYGRRRNVDILDCYLRQNLAVNGGYVDEVWFMVHTEKKEDVDWLREFVRDVPGYTFMDLGACTKQGYGCMWEYAVEDDTIYIKIDDDILYIHHDTIPQLIHTRLAQPHPYAISAQLVNSPVTGMQQYHYGAIHAFLPDPKDRPYRAAAETWRPSEMGLYPRGTRPLEGNPLDVKPSYRGHPWLLLSNTSHNTADLKRTPLGAWNHDRGEANIAFGPGWTSWGAAAQQLYSLLYNLERNEMHRYHFGRRLDYEDSTTTTTTATTNESEYDGPGGENLYDMQYERYNLNFVAIWGADVRAALPIHDDEAEVTAEIPARLGRPFVIDTRAVVGHYSFFTQYEGIRQTDLLDRFRAFANEHVCTAANRKKPWDRRCEGF
ncbi:hypothetical protein F5Y04DRAFT_281326 [Hypomontagnella monticulosa]|nr:hypothetical protein F5Y04DRAFT_281326 [Hypomontagnella monticulosa]